MYISSLGFKYFELVSLETLISKKIFVYILGTFYFLLVQDIFSNSRYSTNGSSKEE